VIGILLLECRRHEQSQFAAAGRERKAGSINATAWIADAKSLLANGGFVGRAVAARFLILCYGSARSYASSRSSSPDVLHRHAIR
jgi:hypothetical protein